MPAPAESSSLLELDHVHTYYGQIHILHDVSLRVGAGELVCLLGGNASGKSTTLKTCLGIVKPRTGTCDVRRRGHQRDEHEYRIGQGMAIVPENRRLFAPMTVLENLQMGAYLRGKGGRRTTIASTRSSRSSTSGAPSSQARCPAASSRWWRWHVR